MPTQTATGCENLHGHPRLLQSPQGLLLSAQRRKWGGVGMNRWGRSNAMGVTADSSLMPVCVPRTGKRCRDSTQNAGRDDFKIPRALPRNPHLGPWHPSSLMWHQGKQRYVHTEFLPHTRRAGAPSFRKNTPAPPYPSCEPRALRRGCGVGNARPASQLREPCRSLQSLHHLVQGTASRRALLIGCLHSVQMPNSSCRIRAKASSMARKSLPSVWCNRSCVAASASPVAMSATSPRSLPAVEIESTRLLPLESSCRFERRRFL